MPKAEATINDKLTQIGKNTRPKTTNNTNGDKHMITDPIQEQHNGRIELVIAILDKTHKIYTDQMGKSPITSSWGKNYVLIMYVYDANDILEEPNKSRSGGHILEDYTKKVEHLKIGATYHR